MGRKTSSYLDFPWRAGDIIRCRLFKGEVEKALVLGSKSEIEHNCYNHYPALLMFIQPSEIFEKHLWIADLTDHFLGAVDKKYSNLFLSSAKLKIFRFACNQLDDISFFCRLPHNANHNCLNRIADLIKWES